MRTEEHLSSNFNSGDKHMQYLLLIYAEETVYAQQTPEEQAAEMEGHNVFAKEAGKKIVGGNALQLTSNATTIRLRDAQTLVTDGPFAETKEHLGGYYLVECENLDEAIALASKLPEVHFGSIEIRPIMKFE
jgi:hypothetical protein